MLPLIATLTRLPVECAAAPVGAIRRFVGGVEVAMLLLPSVVDVDQIDARRAKLEEELARATRKLEDPIFLARAPAPIVEGARAIVAGLQAKLSRLAESGDER